MTLPLRVGVMPGGDRLPSALEAELAAALAAAAPEDAPLVPAAVYGAHLARARDARRAAGAFYTPSHLCELIVERTLAPLLDAAGPEGAATLRVVDPACGAGVFLVAAARAVAARFGPAVARAFADQLAGVDLDPIAAELARRAVWLASGAVPTIVVADGVIGPFPVAGPFDAVIGNPPWGQKGFSWSRDHREHLRAHYRVGRGVIDPFAVFVERAIALLRPGGCWGFALPDVVLLKNQEHVRALMLEQCSVAWICDAGRAFAGVHLDAVAVIARRRPPANDHRVRVWHELPERWRVAPPPTLEIPQATFCSLPGKKLNLRITPASLALWRRLDALPRLGERFEAHEGVHTGNSRAKLFLPAPRGPHCVPIIVGRRELSRFRVRWAGAWLDRDPAALDRDAGDYANLGRPAWHERPKLLVRRTGDRVIAAVDTDGLWCSNNLFVVLPHAAMDAQQLAAYAALLNSDLMTWLFRTAQPRTGRLFAELKLHQLLAFPVPEADRWVAAVPELAAAGPDAGTIVSALFDLSPADVALIAAGC